MSEDRSREYAEWYVWAKRNVSSTAEICHAAAQAAAEAKRAGGDPQAAARVAAQSRSGLGWSHPETPEVRQYAEWYDWGRIELGVGGDDLARATSAAVASLRSGGDAAAAASAARAASGKADVVRPAAAADQPGSLPPPVPGQTRSLSTPPPPPGYAPAQTVSLPPPPPQPPPPGNPPPPPGYPTSAPPTWSPGAYPAPPGGQAGAYGYPAPVGTDGFAIASLVCSIIAVPAICGYGVPAVILGLVGFFLGRSALKRIRASGGSKGGHGIATAGWIVGIIAAVIGAIYAIVAIGLIALVVSGVIPIPSPSPSP